MKKRNGPVTDSRSRVSRRSFLEGVSAGVASFLFIPSSVLGQAGKPSANNRLNIAGVGIGGMGQHNVSAVAGTENIVALCDVDSAYAGPVFKKYPQAKVFADYRRMLDEMSNEIDAVIIATPDHTHAVIAMECIKRGKHVYVQKPLTRTVEEARRLTEAARQYKVATQMGIQGHSTEEVRLTCEWIWSGVIGKVTEVHIWTNRPVWPQGIGRPAETPNVPGSLNWDLWIGPAPMRPYHPIYHPFKWRGWRDFGTGALGDIGCHSFDRVFWALKLNYPISVQGSYANPPLDWQRQDIVETFPTGSRIVYEFPARDDMPPVKICWYDGGLMPDVPEEMEEGRKLSPEGGILFIGEKGKLLNGTQLLPYSLMKEVKRPEKILPRITMSHEMNWVHACKTGEKACADFDFSGPLTEMVLMGNLSLYYPGQKIRWDGQAMQAVNLPEANQYVKHLYREGWSL